VRPFLQNGTISLATMVAITGCTYAFQLIMARRLSVDAFGELNAIVATLNLLTIPLFGGALAITRTVAMRSGSTTTLRSGESVRLQSDRVVLVSVVIAAALLGASPAAAAFFHLSSALPIVILAGLVLVSTLLGVSRAVLVGLHRFVAFGFNQLIEAVSRLMLGVLLVIIGLGQNGALVGYALAMAIAFLAIRDCYPWSGVRSGLPSRLREAIRRPKTAADAPVASISGSATLITGSVLVMLGGDLALVKHFFAEDLAGQYAALSTLGKVMFLVVSAFDTVLFPAAASAQKAGAQPRQQLTLALVSVACIAGPLLLAYWLVPSSIVALIFGDRYLDIAPLVGRYGAAALMISLAALIARYSLALGRTLVRITLPVLAAAEVLALSLLHQSLDQVVNVVLAIGAATLIASILAARLDAFGTVRRGSAALAR
jgi:O-antigen/teichoic acid export membrane protein